MANKISRVIFIIYIINYAWYQQAIGYVPRLSTALLFGLVLTTLIDIIMIKFDYKTLFTREMIIWIVFIIYTLVSGWLIAVDKELVLRAAKLMSKYLLLWIYMIYISMRDKDSKFVVLSLYIMTWFEIVSAFARPVYQYETRLTLGPGNDPNDYANFLLLGIIATLIMLLRNKNKYLITLNTIFALLIAYQIIQTASRQGFVGLMIIVIVSFLLMVDKKVIDKYIIRNKQRLTILFLIGIICSIAIYFIIHSFVFERIVDTILTGYSAGRDKLLFESSQFFINNPIFGVGIDNFQVFSVQKMFSHNTWMELLSTTGVIGFVIYLIMFVIIGKYAWDSYFHNRQNLQVRDKAIKTSVFMTYILLFALSFTTIHFYQMSSTLLLGILLSSKYAQPQYQINKVSKQS